MKQVAIKAVKKAAPEVETMKGTWVQINDYAVPGDEFNTDDVEQAIAKMTEWRQRIALSEKFAEYLRKEIGDEKFLRVRIRNRDSGNPSVCASHDFCDANEVMARAFRVTQQHEPMTNQEPDSTLWTKAWELCKIQHLTARDDEHLPKTEEIKETEDREMSTEELNLAVALWGLVDAVDTISGYWNESVSNHMQHANEMLKPYLAKAMGKMADDLPKK